MTFVTSYFFLQPYWIMHLRFSIWYKYDISSKSHFFKGIVKKQTNKQYNYILYYYYYYIIYSKRWWFPGIWMTPLLLQCCPWWCVGGEQGVPPEVHDHLHCFERVQLQVVKTAPDSQLFNLLSVSRLITILDETDDCSVVRKLQELDWGIFRCAVIGVEGEEQWGENTALRGASADGESSGCEFAQPH